MTAAIATIATYCCDLDRTDPSADIALAEPAELARALRFRRPIDARRFLARRAATRRLLAAQLDRAPDAVVIAHGAFGKPFLVGASLQFSTSHAGPVLLVALADGLPIGCDIEEMSAEHDLPAIAKTCFTAGEASLILAQAGEGRVAAFYDCWTRKEAYLKATGTGLSLPMNSFEFACDQPGPARLDSGGADWSSAAWTPAPGYRAAVAAPGSRWQLDHR